MTSSKGSVTPGPRPELNDGVGWSERRDPLGGKEIGTKPECVGGENVRISWQKGRRAPPIQGPEGWFSSTPMCWASQPKAGSDPESLGLGLRVCISNELLGDAGFSATTSPLRTGVRSGDVLRFLWNVRAHLIAVMEPSLELWKSLRFRWSWSPILASLSGHLFQSQAWGASS